MGSDYTLHSPQSSGNQLSPMPKTAQSVVHGSIKYTVTNAQSSLTTEKTDRVITSIVRRNQNTPSGKVEHAPRKISTTAMTTDDVPGELFSQTVAVHKTLNRRATAPAALMHAKDLTRDREWQFTQVTINSGIDPDTAKHLYQISGGISKDVVTGFGAAQDIELTREVALSRSEKNGSSVLQIDIELANLGELNKSKGGSGADETIRDISKIVKNHLEATGVKVTPFRDGGKFSFIVEANSESAEKHIKGALNDAKVQVKAGLKVSLQEKVTKFTDVKSQTTVASHTDRAYSQTPASETPKQDFFPNIDWSSSQSRHKQFLKSATGTRMISAEKAEELYKISGGGLKDSLTGLDRGVDRLPTLQNAIKEVKTNGATGTYVEADIKNLKGLNKTLGRVQADKAYAKIVDIVKKELTELGAEHGVEVTGFRHGGDEFSFIVLSKNKMPNEKLTGILSKALENAQAKIKEELPEVANIKHEKYPNDTSKAGTGISFGTSPIREDYTAELIIKRADKDLETYKSRPKLASA